MKNVARKLFILILCTMLLLLSGGIASAGESWHPVVNQIETVLEQAVEAYEQGKVEEAKNLVNEAYFGPFEGSQMEKAVKFKISGQRVAELEEEFRLIRKLMTTGASQEEVEKAAKGLVAKLREDAATLSGPENGEYSFFLSSFLILVREGFEAILILGAIIAYLERSGNGNKVKVIYRSALVAVAASFVTALAIKVLFNISGASQEILEGITMLIAVAVLFSVSFWLLSKVEAKKWRDYIEGKIQSSLTAGSTFALWFTAFLAVYREGAETVLFYQALLTGTGRGSLGMIALGFALGCVTLAVLFVAVRLGSVKIPMKPFFIGTSLLMYYLAFVFAGQGVRELQAGGLVGSTPVPGVPIVDLLGIYPTWQSLALQVVLLLAALGGIIFGLLPGPGPKKKIKIGG
ncbi:MAG: FTR1 family iron permease [Clostridia bacterium]|nr:FTR1 family iron permease [Clostridia bacterium]